MKESFRLIWDTTKPFISYPREIKKIYSKVYLNNYNKFNLWIDKMSYKNHEKINWWLNSVSSRDERISLLFHKICILKSLDEIDNFNLKVLLYISSKELQKLIERKKFKNINLKLKKQEYFFKRYIFLSKEFLLLSINIILIKLFYSSRLNKNKAINLLDVFEINQINQESKYFGNFIKSKNIKFFYVPTFLSYSPKNIFKNIKKRTLLKEKFINFFDLIFILNNIFKKNLRSNLKFLNSDFSDLIIEEQKNFLNIRSIIISYINYLFFKNLKKRGIKIKKIFSWYENQIIDKGWSLGINKFYKHVNYIGYQGSTLHPQFFNLSPTKSEYFSGVTPKKIILIGSKYVKNREQYFKGINFQVANENRFNFNLNSKKKYLLFLLSGLREIDETFVNFNNKIMGEKFKNVKIKFHPILQSHVFKSNFKNEIKGDGSKIIQSSRIVITSSYTSGLYESIASGSYTILINCTPLDKLLFKELKKYTNRISLCSSYDNLIISINKFLKKRNNKNSKNLRVKKFFFNK